MLVCWIYKRYKGYYFYYKSDMKVFVSTNAKFMKEEYIMNHIIRNMNEWTKKKKGLNSLKSKIILFLFIHNH